jgi:hypothetical protein
MEEDGRRGGKEINRRAQAKSKSEAKGKKFAHDLDNATTSSGTATRPASAVAHSTTTAREAVDDDVEDGQDTINNGIEDAHNGVCNTSDGGTDGLEDSSNLN